MKYVPVLLPEETVRILADSNFARVLVHYGEVMPIPMKNLMGDLNIAHYACRAALRDKAPAEEPVKKERPWAFTMMALLAVILMYAAGHWRSVAQECLYPTEPGPIERIVP